MKKTIYFLLAVLSVSSSFGIQKKTKPFSVYKIDNRDVFSILCTFPTVHASLFVTSLVSSTSMTVSWTRGNGDNVLIIAKKAFATDSPPVDGTNYTANAGFGLGDQIGTENFVIYNGNGTTVDLTGLESTTTYHFSIYEYNTTGNCYNQVALTGNETTCTLPNIPQTITGRDTICKNETSIIYSTPEVVGATSYLWTLPAGASITSNSLLNTVTVNFGTSSGTLSVNAVNSCGASTVLNPVKILVSGQIPEKPSEITGETVICDTALTYKYTVLPVSGADSYSWTFPAGTTIISGKNTDTVTVKFSLMNESNISVSGKSICSLSKMPASIKMIFPEKIVISSQPETASLCVGQPVTFSVSANSKSYCKYNWQKENVDIQGANSADFNIPEISFSDSGIYKCILTGCNIIESVPVALNIDNAIITRQPDSIYTVDEGSDVNINFEATGNIKSYTWEKIGIGSLNINTSDLTYENVGLQTGGAYICIITDVCKKLTLTKQAIISIVNVKMPVKPVAINSGEYVTIEVPNAGAGFSYQWRKNGTNISDTQKNGIYSGCTTFRLLIKSVSVEDEGDYDCLIYGPGFNASSEVFNLALFVGLKEQLDNFIEIYPNPAKDIFYIDLRKFCQKQEFPQNYNLKIVDINGKIVFKQKLDTSSKNEINLSGKAKGTYFVNLKFRDFEILRKIVLE